MTDYVHLVGAEQVQSAGSRIASAAEDIRRAAGSLDDSFRRHEAFLNDWLMRFEAAIDRHAEKADPPADHQGDAHGNETTE